jgi:hypothetical protein
VSGPRKVSPTPCGLRWELASGTELNFVDSYKFNIAAYQLAELLGLNDMLPVYVERKWHGDTGSLSWWLPGNG